MVKESQYCTCKEKLRAFIANSRICIICGKRFNPKEYKKLTKEAKKLIKKEKNKKKVKK